MDEFEIIAVQIWHHKKYQILYALILKIVDILGKLVLKQTNAI